VKVLTVVGARPQFIKAWPVARALVEAGIHEVLVHTGQHYDDRMSRVFFEEMGIRPPDRNLEIGSGLHGEQTGRMLIALETVMLEERPDWLLVYGDTNTTLAAAIAACKLEIPIAHVEAGLRSFNRSMPEEHNRVLTDHCSTLLFCPTQTAVDHLSREGVTAGVRLVGDVMFDAVLHFGAVARERSRVLQTVGVEPGGYHLATIHRPYNTDEPERLAALLSALDRLDAPVVFPIHPRTRARLGERGEATSWRQVRLVEPVGYLDMLRLEQGARAVLTDSGGVQKEAYFFAVPCFTLRSETEWVETVESGWNTLVSGDPSELSRQVAAWNRPSAPPPPLFGDGRAAGQIARVLSETMSARRRS
jgi:UDP-GlcNAc3NAcA epimerase